MVDLTGLSDDQLSAVKWQEGPLLTLGGPGSGKTHALAHRIARITSEPTTWKFKILGLASTGKSANEMRNRVMKLIPDEKERLVLTTFHAYANEILKWRGDYIGIDYDLSVLPKKSDQLLLLNEAIETSNHGNKDLMCEKLLPLFNNLSELDKESAVEIVEWLKHHSFSDSEMIAEIYLQYKDLMMEKNTFDIPSMMSKTIKLLTLPGDGDFVRELYQGNRPFVCIDDFQDISPLNYKFLKLVVNPKSNNLFVNADDSQIIHKWNGESGKRLSRLQSDFNMNVLHLPENYHCPNDIVLVANKLIVNNFDESSALNFLNTHRRRSQMTESSVQLHQFENFSDEMQWVATDIANHSKEDREKCTVFAGSKHLLKHIFDALKQLGVIGYLPNCNEFESTHMVWYHSVLKLAVSRTNEEYLRRVCKAFYLLSGIELAIQDIVSHAGIEEEDYLRSWANAVLKSGSATERTRKMISDSLLPNLTERLDFQHFQNEAFNWLDELCGNEPESQRILNAYGIEKADWEMFLSEMERKNEGSNGITLHFALREIDRHLNSKIPAPDGTPCQSLNSYKGLKSDHVYVVGLADGLCPSWSAINKHEENPSRNLELHEERRNCFAAITRARKSATLTCSSEFYGWKLNPSRFLHEMELLDRDADDQFSNEDNRKYASTG